MATASDDLTRRATEGPPAPRPEIGKLVRTALKPLASLQLTVALFALSIVLVFVGTLAQRELGIWHVVDKYFRSLVVVVPLQVLVPESVAKVPGAFPFPGGWTLGGLLLVNLIAAHAVRFRVTWKRAGVLVAHSGLILLLVGELVTGLFAVEGNMTIEEGKSANYIESTRYTELAVLRANDDGKTDTVTVVPGKMLRPGAAVSHDLLPFDLSVGEFMANSSFPRVVKPGEANKATAGDGLKETVVERPQVSGTDPDQKVDMASAFVTLKDKKTGEPLGTYLFSQWFDAPQEVTVNGQKYGVALRFQREYKPYTVTLHDFTHERYRGTETAKNFQSDVQLVDPTTGTDRRVKIYMNNPLRYGGETFFQASFLRGDKGTVLQVVRNPGWTLPYLSCALVTLGLAAHFGMSLVNFLSRRAVA